MSLIDAVASTAIIRDIDHFLFQRKTAGYPIGAFVGQLCLIGGAWTKAADQNARDTLSRELAEEISAVDIMLSEATWRFAGLYEVLLSEDVTRTKSFNTLNFVFEISIPQRLRDLPHDLLEGEAALVSFAEAHDHKYCWGYDRILEDYARRFDVPFGPLESQPSVVRLVDTLELPYRQLDLDRLRVNPVQSGDVPDERPFESD